MSSLTFFEETILNDVLRIIRKKQEGKVREKELRQLEFRFHDPISYKKFRKFPITKDSTILKNGEYIVIKTKLFNEREVSLIIGLDENKKLFAERYTGEINSINHEFFGFDTFLEDELWDIEKIERIRVQGDLVLHRGFTYSYETLKYTILERIKERISEVLADIVYEIIQDIIATNRIHFERDPVARRLQIPINRTIYYKHRYKSSYCNDIKKFLMKEIERELYTRGIVSELYFEEIETIKREIKDRLNVVIPYDLSILFTLRRRGRGKKVLREVRTFNPLYIEANKPQQCN